MIDVSSIKEEVGAVLATLGCTIKAVYAVPFAFPQQHRLPLVCVTWTDCEGEHCGFVVPLKEIAQNLLEYQEGCKTTWGYIEHCVEEDTK